MGSSFGFHRAGRIAWVILAICLASPAIAEQWLYVDPLRPMRLFSIETAPPSFGIDDVRSEAAFCPPAHAYHCVRSAHFRLYLPKEISAASRWQAEGDSYVVSAQGTLSLLGREEEVYFIDRRSPKEEGTVRFLYSKRRGLVGMGGYTDRTSALFLLAGDCGFAAPATCAGSTARPR